MFRSQLFIPKKVIIHVWFISLLLMSISHFLKVRWKRHFVQLGFACFFLVSISCKIEKDDAILPEYILEKGTLYSDPAVRSVAMKNFLTINMLNDWENGIIKQKSNLRPAKINGYDNSISKFIHFKEFSFSQPAWIPTKSKVIIAAIFKNTIQVEKNEIKNKEDIVWYWDSKGKNDPGKVIISDGNIASFENGKFVFSKVTQEPFLKPGNYIFCILVWDNYGQNIIAASKEVPFNLYENIID